MSRRYSASDRLLMGLAAALSGAAPVPSAVQRHCPARAQDGVLSDADRRHAAGLMRVNHAGEVAAQALYRGQALVARDGEVRRHLEQAATEEEDHLRWCESRLSELDEAPSRLRPLWYAGSFAIGAAAGLAGDGISLGFVQETERQVVEHLEGHLRELPTADQRSREIVRAMRDDEARHGAEAQAAGAAPLPEPVRGLMRAVARVMTRGAYWF